MVENSAENSAEYSNCLIDQYNERANPNFLYRFLAANFDPVKKSKNCSNPRNFSGNLGEQLAMRN